MTRLPAIPVSILDRANTREGSSAAESLEAPIRRAQRAEQLGYHRFWVAEHHAIPGIVGSTPTLLMAAIAARTEHIRVGSGGVMLPNHQPLVVAEQAATLQALFPGRIDLGIGRSVGFTKAIREALRQGPEAKDRFGDDLTELLSYLDGSAAITARPEDDATTPPFVLAMGRGQEFAARAGVAVVVGGAAFTGRKPEVARSVLQRYRDDFRPSVWYSEPYVIVSANIAIGETSEQARELLLPEAWAMAASRTVGDYPPLAPVDAVLTRITPKQKPMIDEYLAAAVHGTADEVAERLATVLDLTGADELMVTTNTFDTAALAAADHRLAALFDLG